MNIIILCGGKGERLRPFTESIPKPLVTVKDKPILSYIIKQLISYKLDDIHVMTGYKGEMIDSYLKKNFAEEQIKTFNNGDVDIIERIKHIVGLNNMQDLLILYGDTISDVNLHDLIINAQENKNPVTTTIWPLVSQFGIVELDENNNVTAFKEKPKLNKWINIGYIYIKTEMFPTITEFVTFESFLKVIADNKKLSAFKHEGHHFTVNNVVELAHAEKNIHKIII